MSTKNHKDIHFYGSIDFYTTNLSGFQNPIGLLYALL